ncbi:hypothetical protein EMIT036CA2_40231 [Chryseobacterium sp. IT-36CA2]
MDAGTSGVVSTGCGSIFCDVEYGSGCGMGVVSVLEHENNIAVKVIAPMVFRISFFIMNWFCY